MNTSEDAKVTIEVPLKRYRTDDGVPTCARSFSGNQVCPFFVMASPFDPGGRCGLVESVVQSELPRIARVEPGQNGCLQPHKNCPLWREE